ncbi:MAG: response regulator transcription factor [Chitinophagaceae bacterium]|nr:MAG: response regulator transcription factor [Chitinophagaceae bacterium]
MKSIKDRYSIIIADDHVSVREGLQQILGGNPHFFVLEAVCNGHELERVVDQQQPDLVITDVRMPEGGGVETGQQLKSKFPELYLIGYTGWDTDSLFLDMLKVGFDGIILKRAGKEEVLEAVHMVLDGNMGFCRAAQRRVHQLIQRNYYNPGRNKVKPLMSERYLTIIKYIADGWKSEEIAEKMGLGVQSIHTYRKRLLTKTGCTNPASLIHYANLEGLIDNPD